WCLPPRICWSSTSVFAWRVRRVTGGQETPLPASAHRRRHDQHWPSPDPASATQLAVDGVLLGSLQAAARAASHHLSRRLHPGSVATILASRNPPCPGVATKHPRQYRWHLKSQLPALSPPRSLIALRS